jgi:DNA-binding transcriptional LysR family regulator
MHLTQPVVSRTLRQLEQHLGIRLIDRSTHHLQLTAAGHAFRIRAAAAVTAADSAFDRRQIGTWPLRLGHAWAALGGSTTALLRAWTRAHPGMPLELRRIDDRTAGLTRGEVDAAILRGPITTPGIRSQALTTEPRSAAVPADSPLAAQARLTLADLADYPIALNTVSGTTSLELWTAETRPARTINVANTDDWLATIAAGQAVGVTAVATTSMHAHPGVSYRPLTDAPDLTVFLAWTHPPSHPAITKLASLARDVLSGQSPSAAAS